MELKELGLQSRTVNALAKKKLYTVNDMAMFVPRVYRDYRNPKYICDLVDGEFAAVYGRLLSLNKKFGSRWYLVGKIENSDGKKLTVMWFTQVDRYAELYGKYISKEVVVCGKIDIHPKFGCSISNPEHLYVATSFIPKIDAIYSNIKSVSDEMRDKIVDMAVEYAEEPLSWEVMSKYQIPSYKDSLKMVHNPQTLTDITVGKERLLLNDLLYFAISFRLGENCDDNSTNIHFEKTSLMQQFEKTLPFELTEDQNSTIKAMIDNSVAGKRNNILVQGDVGCGKTIVAALMMITAYENGYQSVLMAPREVLAKQHYAELSGYAEKLGIKSCFLHSGMKAKEKKEIFAKIKSGEISFIIGTHSCLSPSVEYGNLGLVVTDEEHLFGVDQKEQLEAKAQAGVHSLSMSATPIPRTLATIMYGNKKEIMTIKSRPKGRIPIQTATQLTHTNTFPFMEKQIRMNHQCYVVCPAIDDNDKSELISIETMYKEYQSYFEPKGIKIGVVHGKMDKQEVESVVNRFKNNEIHILMSTTVIEVGVNVPNATVMVIEQAERFGLASLHQLRGRVGRSSLPSYCILRSDEANNDRLKVMVETTDGFKIAEADLRQRGSGNLIGVKQAGANKYVEEMLNNPELFKRASEIASFCNKHGYADKLIDLYKEHDQHVKE